MENQVIIEETAHSAAPDSSAISSMPATPATKLNDRECSNQIFGICGASLSATSRAAGGAPLSALHHDDQRQQLIDDPSLIPEAIENASVGSNGYSPSPAHLHPRHRSRRPPILKGMVVRGGPSPLAPNTIRMRSGPDEVRHHRKQSASCHSARGRITASAELQFVRPHDVSTICDRRRLLSLRDGRSITARRDEYAAPMQ